MLWATVLEVFKFEAWVYKCPRTALAMICHYGCFAGVPLICAIMAALQESLQGKVSLLVTTIRLRLDIGIDAVGKTPQDDGCSV